MTDYIVPASHEFAANFLFTEYGLNPFFAADRRVKEGSGSQRSVFTDQGGEWTVTLYYQPSNIVYPGERLPSGTAWRLDEMREFRMTIARHGEEDPVGEQSFNAHLAPRWPGMEAESDDGTTHQISVSDGLKEAVNVHVQGLNIEFDRYRRLLQKAASAVDIRSEYFEDLHEFSKSKTQSDTSGFIEMTADQSTLGMDQSRRWGISSSTTVQSPRSISLVSRRRAMQRRRALLE